MSKILIFARSLNNIIGLKDTIPWHIKEDMQFFKYKTTNNIVVMGRKTFETLGNKPLPNRINIVVSKTLFKSYSSMDLYSFENKIIYTKTIAKTLCFLNDINEELKKKKQIEKDIYFIGGVSIYKEAIGYCDEIYETVLNKIIAGDTKFSITDTEQGILPWDLLSTQRFTENDIEYNRNHYKRIIL
jgi:dihydrofolate reductase